MEEGERVLSSEIPFEVLDSQLPSERVQKQLEEKGWQFFRWSDLRGAIRGEKGGFRVPQESWLEERLKEKTMVEKLFDFLRGPIIVDCFPNHQKRREWRRNQERTELGEFYERNVLRGNRLATALLAGEILAGNYDLGEVEERLKKLREEFQDDQRRDRYDGMRIEEKKELVLRIGEAVAALLRTIGEKLAQSSLLGKEGG